MSLPDWTIILCLDPANDFRLPIRCCRHELRHVRARTTAFFQGLLEGIASIEAHAYRHLALLGAPALRRVISIGGGAKSDAWATIRRRILGVPVSTAEQTEACYGAALLALRGALKRTPSKGDARRPSVGGAP